MPNYFVIFGPRGRTAGGGYYWITDKRPGYDVCDRSRPVGDLRGWTTVMRFDVPLELMRIIDLFARQDGEFIVHNSCCEAIQNMIEASGGLHPAYVRAVQAHFRGDTYAQQQAMNEHTPRRAREITSEDDEFWARDGPGWAIPAIEQVRRQVRRENGGLDPPNTLETQDDLNTKLTQELTNRQLLCDFNDYAMAVSFGLIRFGPEAANEMMQREGANVFCEETTSNVE